MTMKDKWNIEEIFKNEISRAKKRGDIFLQHGLMGICVASYIMYKYTHEIKYKRTGDKLLDYVIEHIHTNCYLEIPNGICGIATGIMYLIRTDAIEGDETMILKEIDEYIYRGICSKMEEESTDIRNYQDTILDILLYYSFRINTNYGGDIYEKEFQTQFFLFLLNRIYIQHTSDFYQEPFPPSSSYKLFKFLFILSNAVKNESCKERTIHILKECEILILSHFPYYEANRYLILCALCKLKESVTLPHKWEVYIHTLKNHLTPQHIIFDEFETNSLYISKGLCGIYFLSHLFPSIDIKFSLSDLKKKVQISDYYITPYYSYIQKRGFVGLDGILGLIVVFKIMEKYEKI